MENVWVALQVIAVAVVALIGIGGLVAAVVSYYNEELVAAIGKRLEASAERARAERKAAEEWFRFSQQLQASEERLQAGFSQQLRASERRLRTELEASEERLQAGFSQQLQAWGEVLRAEREASEERLQAGFSQQLQASEERLQAGFSQQLQASEKRLRTEQQASEKRLQEQISSFERAVRVHVDQQLTALEKRNEVQHGALETKIDGVSEEVKQATESVTVLRTEVSRLEGYSERRVVEALRGTSGSAVGQG